VVAVLGEACSSTFSSHPNGITADVECADDPSQTVGSHLLLAVGRIPNTHDLGLDAAGVEVDERGLIKVDDQLRTNVEGIWVLGLRPHHGYALCIDPPLGRIGMTEVQARESGRIVLVGTRPMQHVGRAKERSETAGFISLS
jgi:pyruvate/2-oxoglutarate dehydrogenase complex dihydrolipoamide dehydrogenase (E3) component